MTRRIFITIEYDGGPFVGWQRQVTGPSVQQVLEEAAAELTGGEILVQGAGRTDSGVHATGQVAHLDVPDKFDANRVMEALNAL
ncbi:MAG: tRNA pseudouridine(38-40) synthase TruA, partial [Pseudomonadota bacterium]|nr:tRNA pseudouridine(38-40) synthase TruA [Pseudomonadota bacterium]